MSRLDGMTPNELLAVWTSMGGFVGKANDKARQASPGRQRRGRAGAIRLAKRKRIRARDRQLQRTTWRSFAEREKREALEAQA